MAATVPTLVLKKVDRTGRRWRRIFQLTFAAGDYVALGVPLNLTANLTNPEWFERGIRFGRNPSREYRVLNHPAGYVLTLVPGAAQTNWLIRLFYVGADGVMTEHAAGALAAGLVADTSIRLEFDEPIL